jgi:uncharacterized Fe-S cluster-containing radical SAM superfamily protein
MGIYELIKYTSKIIKVSKPVTKFFGYRFNPNHKLIEIDITYDCDLKCFNCDRSCRQAPSKEYMSTKQLKKFIDESIEQDRRWDRIRLLGGEPTLHPNILEILNLFAEYKRDNSPKTCIQLVTNGFGKKSNTVTSESSSMIEIENTHKKTTAQDFESYNIAPVDIFRYMYSDYSNGCWITDSCGIGLTRYGFYPCAAGGAIDRVLGLDIGKKKLPHVDDGMRRQLDTLCRYCGHFKFKEVINKEIISSTWKKAYEKYKIKKPTLSLY